MNALKLLYFLDVPVMVIRCSMERSNSFIHHAHGSGLCLNHGNAGMML